MIEMRVKSLFFDPPRVRRAVSAATGAALSKAGAFSPAVCSDGDAAGYPPGETAAPPTRRPAANPPLLRRRAGQRFT